MAEENSGSENVANWKGYGPPWLSAEHWNEIIDKHWNNEGWKKKSKLGLDNRLTVKSGTITKHIVGSITIAAHKLRLYEKLGKPPSASQLFERVHRRKKGEGDFVDNKSWMVHPQSHSTRSGVVSPNRRHRRRRSPIVHSQGLKVADPKQELEERCKAPCM